jgi:transposase
LKVASVGSKNGSGIGSKIAALRTCPGSIGGIGRVSATVLYCEIGDIDRFSSPKQLAAYAGLDPRREQSGDQQIDRSITGQGNRRIRSILYGCARGCHPGR